MKILVYNLVKRGMSYENACVEVQQYAELCSKNHNKMEKEQRKEEKKNRKKIFKEEFEKICKRKI